MVQAVQRFKLWQAPGAFGAEWVCADDQCLAPMIMVAQEGDDPGTANETEMTHTDGCRYSKEPTAQR